MEFDNGTIVINGGGSGKHAIQKFKQKTRSSMRLSSSSTNNFPEFSQNRRTQNLHGNEQAYSHSNRLRTYNTNINLFQPKSSYIMRIEEVRVWTLKFKSRFRELQSSISQTKHITILYAACSFKRIWTLSISWDSKTWHTWNGSDVLMLLACFSPQTDVEQSSRC